ncbi:hypothetical protein MTO96_037902 [Rhipicephalus appendiculatus]
MQGIVIAYAFKCIARADLQAGCQFGPIRIPLGRTVTLRDPCVRVSGFLRQHLQSESGLVALAVLRFLWEHHRCVVAVQLFDVLLKNSSLFDGRAGKSRLKRLTIVVDPDEWPFRVGDLAEYIGWMFVDEGVELRFIDGVYRLNAGESLLLTLLEHWAKRITVLDLTGLAVEAAVAETIVDALLKNISVTDLAVGFHIFASGAECRSSEHFARYLTEKKAMLRRLYLDAYDMNDESNSSELLATLVQAICEMASLEELTARWLCKASDIGLLGGVLVSNNRLPCSRRAVPALLRPRGSPAAAAGTWRRA